MLIFPHERMALARLLSLLERGEQLAHDCAMGQAAIAPEPRMRRFLQEQAKQEYFHATTFRWAAAWLAPRHLGSPPDLEPLSRYRDRVNDALHRGAFAESVLAVQVVLEGVGEVVLKRIEVGLSKRHAPFGRLRRLLLKQEEAHHAFGLRALERAVSNGKASAERLRMLSPEYLGLAISVLASAQDLLESIDEDAAAYAAEVKDYVPRWLIS
jgi:hypothetical protein